MTESDLSPRDETNSERTAQPPAGGGADDGAAAASTSAPAIDEVDTLRKERDENYDRYLRAVADLENYRRRVVREKDELRQFALRGLVESLLPVLENLRLAITSAQQTPDPHAIAAGVALVVDQFRSALAAVGATEISPAVGADFDPHQHESLAHAPSDAVPEEKIVQLVRPGFALNGRLIRPASVVLSSGPAAKSAGSAGA